LARGARELRISRCSVLRMPGFGAASMTGKLERVLVRPLLQADVAGWRAAGWRAEPDPVAAAREHEAFCLLLEETGTEIVVSHHDPGNPDALYPYDPVLVGRDGAVLLRPGKVGRRRGPAALAPELEGAGVRGAWRAGRGRARRARARRGRGHALAGRADAPRRDRLPDERGSRGCARGC